MTVAGEVHHRGVAEGARHALAWLVIGNSIGLLLSILLLKPQWQPGAWTYGHWTPVHLNAQLYGWTALPLVAWLMRLYEVEQARFRQWGSAVVWAWTASLVSASLLWLNGVTSGKLFLDWRNASLWGFVAALVILWLLLAASWFERARHWTRRHYRLSLGGLVILGMVPLVMIFAASPRSYPPIDLTTGGPTGSSLQGSTLLIICLMLLLPRAPGLEGKGRAGWGTWTYFGVSWTIFVFAEAKGGGHHDWWQLSSMASLLPWAWLIARDWSGFHWPEGTLAWRMSMFGWWVLLVLTAVGMYSPGVLDRIKFTQGLVAHSHLAMAGLTTSFCGLLLSVLVSRAVGTPGSVVMWNTATLGMLVVLASMGWREGQSAEWMILPARWRELGLALRALCGAVMWGVSLHWWWTSWKGRIA